jgi:SAM-dependent methyltransferase
VVTRGEPAGDFDYEQHGTTYASVRRPDPRIAAQVLQALGASRTVLNVGAGAGSYEPADRYVLAVEPSAAMRAQRPVGAAPAVDAAAEQLPFDDDSFDAALATMTVHQWRDVDRGLRELRRVSRGPVVVLTLDAPALRQFWLTDYIPEVVAVEEARFPRLDRVVDALTPGSTAVRVDVVAVPRDCSDGFGEAFFARPEAFLRPEVRAATSGLVLTDPGAVQRGLDRLEEDLASGAWDQRYGHLRAQAERHGALRLVTASTAEDLRCPQADRFSSTARSRSA